MGKLDCLDAELSAPPRTLETVCKTVTRPDIDAVVQADLPFETKEAQLGGLIALLEGRDRDDLRDYAKASLDRLNLPDDPIIPQIES